MMSAANGDANSKIVRMTHIPAIFGRELSHSVDYDGRNVLRFAIRPCEDLIIDKEIECEATFPNNFVTSAGQVVLRTKQPSVFYETGVLIRDNDRADEVGSDNSNIVRFPWLNTATKYPISVWFYSARRVLKQPKRSIWKTPIIVKHNFVENKRQYALEGFIADVDPNDDTLSFSSSGTMNVIKSTWGHGAVQGERAGDEKVVPIVGAGRTKGKRNYMEDVDFTYDSIRVRDGRSVSVFGVLDGHGGKECAQYCADEIPVKIAATLKAGKSCPEALFRSFLESDEEFLHSPSGNTSGSTANVMLWDPASGYAYVANTADTRAVLSRQGVALDLTIDRKASDPEEIARIAESGGFVANGRVQGTLAVSRALGDSQLKAPGRKVLIADPEITTFRPCALIDEFVVIATDGLWDVMSSQDVVYAIRSRLEKAGLLGRLGSGSSKSAEAVAAELSRVADGLASHAVQELRSQDNVTVMIVYLRNSSGLAGRPSADDDDAPLEVHSSYWDVDDATETGGIPRSPTTAGAGSGSSRHSQWGGAGGGRGVGVSVTAGAALSRKRPGDGCVEDPSDAHSGFGIGKYASSSSGSHNRNSSSSITSHDGGSSSSGGGSGGYTPDALDTVFAEMPTRASSKYGYGDSGGGSKAEKKPADPGKGGGDGGNNGTQKKAVDDDLLDFLLDDSNF